MPDDGQRCVTDAPVSGRVAARVPVDAVTTANIEALRDEAAMAGDAEQVRLCDAALQGDDEAWEACADAILDARAMADD